MTTRGEEENRAMDDIVGSEDHPSRAGPLFRREGPRRTAPGPSERVSPTHLVIVHGTPLGFRDHVYVT